MNKFIIPLKRKAYAIIQTAQRMSNNNYKVKIGMFINPKKEFEYFTLENCKFTCKTSDKTSIKL